MFRSLREESSVTPPCHKRLDTTHSAERSAGPRAAGIRSHDHECWRLSSFDLSRSDVLQHNPQTRSALPDSRAVDCRRSPPLLRRRKRDDSTLDTVAAAGSEGVAEVEEDHSLAGGAAGSEALSQAVLVEDVLARLREPTSTAIVGRGRGRGSLQRHRVERPVEVTKYQLGRATRVDETTNRRRSYIAAIPLLRRPIVVREVFCTRARSPVGSRRRLLLPLRSALTRWLLRDSARVNRGASVD